MDSGYGCAGEWRCLKAAALGEGEFDKPSQVISFVTCECPGRSLVANAGVAMKMSEMKPDVIHLSSCLAKAKPDCPYSSAEQFAQILESKFQIPVVLGTHEYH
jgi:predicted metal-binding protein